MNRLKMKFGLSICSSMLLKKWHLQLVPAGLPDWFSELPVDFYLNGNFLLDETTDLSCGIRAAIKCCVDV